MSKVDDYIAAVELKEKLHLTVNLKYKYGGATVSRIDNSGDLVIAKGHILDKENALILADFIKDAYGE